MTSRRIPMNDISAPARGFFYYGYYGFRYAG